MENEVRLIALNMVLLGIMACLGYRLWQFTKRERQLKIEKKKLMIKNARHELFFKRMQRKNRSLRQKEDFKLKILSVASHDLRTPFQNLKMLLSHAEELRFTEKDNKWINTLLRNQIQVSEKVLENLLFWTSQQLDIKETKLEAFSVSQQVEAVVRLFALQMNNKNIVLKNSIAESTVAFGKVEMFQFALRNLLSNAIKFSHENSSIEIGASEEPFSVESFVYVRDYGCGMDPIVLKKIREREYQTSLSGTKNEKGSGLGLALCQDLIARIGWQLDVHSVPQQGTTFQLLLPLKSKEAPLRQQVQELTLPFPVQQLAL